MLVRNKNDGVHNVHNLCSLHHHMFVKKDGYIKSTGEKCIRKKYKELAMLCLSADNATVTGGPVGQNFGPKKQSLMKFYVKKLYTPFTRYNRFENRL